MNIQFHIFRHEKVDVVMVEFEVIISQGNPILQTYDQRQLICFLRCDTLKDTNFSFTFLIPILVILKRSLTTGNLLMCTYRRTKITRNTSKT